MLGWVQFVWFSFLLCIKFIFIPYQLYFVYLSIVLSQLVFCQLYLSIQIVFLNTFDTIIFNTWYKLIVLRQLYYIYFCIKCLCILYQLYSLYKKHKHIFILSLPLWISLVSLASLNLSLSISISHYSLPPNMYIIVFILIQISSINCICDTI